VVDLGGVAETVPLRLAAKEQLVVEELGPTELQRLAPATPLALLAFADRWVGDGVQARILAAWLLALQPMALNPKVDLGSQQIGYGLSCQPHRLAEYQEQLVESTSPGSRTANS